MKSVVLDTNALLRYFLNDVPSQKKEVDHLFLNAKNQAVTVLIPQAVIFEFYYVLYRYYGLDKFTIVTTLKSLMSADYIDIESRAEFIISIKLFASSSMSLADCFLLAVARELNAEIFTFDKKLKKHEKST